MRKWSTGFLILFLFFAGTAFAEGQIDPTRPQMLESLQMKQKLKEEYQNPDIINTSKYIKPTVTISGSKLPCKTMKFDYGLEYGSDSLEIHEDAITPGQKVVIVDDLLATGGTMEAIIHLVERLGGKVVKIVFVLELKGLDGMKKLAGYDCSSLVSYEGK